jgi:DNA invertase Pin-like site-specific DNA recombinase
MSNVGEDKDTLNRQETAVAQYAQRMGLKIEVQRYDAGKTGDSAIAERIGFSELISECQQRQLSVILVENASRFSRDLIHQEVGVAQLQKLGITLIPVDAPETFTEDSPSRVLIRQMLGAVSQFEKGNLVAKLKGARDRKRAATGKKVEGRKSFSEKNPELVVHAKRISRQLSKKRSGQTKSLREIAQTLYDQEHTDKVLSAQSVSNLLKQKVA